MVVKWGRKEWNSMTCFNISTIGHENEVMSFFKKKKEKGSFSFEKITEREAKKMNS